MDEQVTNHVLEKLKEILNGMQCEADLEVKEADEEENILINITSKEDIGLIIGKEGATLQALEMIIRAIAGKQFSRSTRIILDADNYLIKREENLKSNALDVVGKVETMGVATELGQMTPRERRLIHIFLQGNKRIHTYSRGEGKDRRLVIAPGPPPSSGDEDQRQDIF